MHAALAVARYALTGDPAAKASTQAALLRCVFGNPFRRAAVAPAVLRWNDGMAVKLAATVYNDRAFDRTSLLADSLEDAGCTDADLLSHLRGPEPHVRGCWAVDLVLGKE